MKIWVSAFLLLFIIISCSNLKFLTEDEFKNNKGNNTSGNIVSTPFPGIYVSAAGDNSNGLTPATAFNSIQDGINAANSGSEKKVLVASGSYSTAANTQITLYSDIELRGGYSTDFLTRNMTSTTEIIGPGGATYSNLIQILNQTNVIIDGFRLNCNSTYAAYRQVIYCNGSSGIKISNCDIIFSSSIGSHYGVQTNNATVDLINNVIKIGSPGGNSYGIFASGTTYFTVNIFNNTIDAGTGTYIRYCIYHNNSPIASLSDIRNNIIISSVYSNSYGVTLAGTAVAAYYNNAYINIQTNKMNAGSNSNIDCDDAGSILIPSNLFVDYSGGDWHLRPSTDTTLTANFNLYYDDILHSAQDLSAYFITDKDGITKSTDGFWSRGAYEQDL